MAKKEETPAPTTDISGTIQSLATLLQGGGTAGGTQDFLGLPANETEISSGRYQVPIEQGVKAPRYYNGAQLLPLLEDWTPQDTWKLQQQLIGAGVLDDDFRQGVWDPKSQAAFSEILGYANSSGTDWREAMNKYNAGTAMTIDPKTGQPVKRTTTKKGQAPLVLKYTNPDDLAEVANNVAQKRLGRTFSQDELNRFVTSYHGTEAGAQTGAYNAGVGAGGGITEAPAPDTAALTYARKIDPVASTAMNIIPLIEGVNQLMRGIPGVPEARGQ